jgi:predicted metal-binding membrane protein
MAPVGMIRICHWNGRAGPEQSGTLPGAFNSFLDIVDPGCSFGSMFITAIRDRKLVVLSIFAMCVLAWAYLIYLTAGMPSMASGTTPMSIAIPSGHDWALADFAAMFLMWSVMMIAMMLPSATPMILLYEKINQKRESQGRAAVALFIGGYLLVWIGFSVLATMLNWALHTGGSLTTMMGRATPAMAGAALLGAGIYQWTSLKYACLTHCRSPVGFLMAHWRTGQWGTVRMGIHHGLYCLGCCWLLMVLLFVLGVMNLLWIAALTVLVLAEKAIPRGHLLSRISGLFMITWGGWLIIFAV